MARETGGSSFDDLAKGLAAGTLSRRNALRLMGAALFGGALASYPGAAWAARGGNSACSKYCKTLFAGDTPAQEECVSQGAKGTGPCYTCTPGVGPGPNYVSNCPPPHTHVDPDRCECICPPCGPNEFQHQNCECQTFGTCLVGSFGCNFCLDPNSDPPTSVPCRCYVNPDGTDTVCGGESSIHYVSSCDQCTGRHVCIRNPEVGGSPELACVIPCFDGSTLCF